MLTILSGFLAKYAVETLFVAIGGPIIAFFLKKIPTGKWTKELGEAGVKAGKKFTTFASEKIPFYNKYIEPTIVDTLAFIPAFVAGFIVGLKSDNQE